MKKLVKVYYTVQYVKEVELELDKTLINIFDKSDKVELFNYDLTDIENNNEILESLPIAELYRDDIGDILLVDYVEDSLEINYFTK